MPWKWAQGHWGKEFWLPIPGARSEGVKSASVGIFLWSDGFPSHIGEGPEQSPLNVGPSHVHLRW